MQDLISLSHRIAGEEACAQAHDIPLLRARARALVNARKVPAALQETLMSGVNALGAQTPVCLPSVKPTTTVSLPPPTVVSPSRPARPHGHGHGRPKGPGHGHGHGHGGKKH